MPRVIVLFDGYSRPTARGQEANCSCTLIKSEKNTIVDTMTAWDGPRIVERLANHGLQPDDINYVVSTHGHSDHVGNNNLFLRAHHIVGTSVSFKDQYYDDLFDPSAGLRIDGYVTVIPTPGHTSCDVTVIVREVEGLGTVAVSGDLFENEGDLRDADVWKNAGSENEVLQEANRRKVLGMADYIVPGHGPMFRVVR